jgi:hypothetical protein
VLPWLRLSCINHLHINKSSCVGCGFSGAFYGITWLGDSVYCTWPPWHSDACQSPEYTLRLDVYALLFKLTRSRHAGNCKRSSLQSFTCDWTGLLLQPGQTYVVSYTAVARQAGVFTNTAACNPADDMFPGNNEASVKVEVMVSTTHERPLAVLHFKLLSQHCLKKHA